MISDGDGTTSDPAFTAFIASYLSDAGYSAPLNDPYKGADLVNRYSNPRQGRHSVQIEMNRKHYMNEAAVEKSDTFADFQRVPEGLIAAIADYARTAA